MQLNNQIFFVSDEPEHYSSKPQDDHEAVHLIQAHGSIFRPFLANTEKEIQRLREENSAGFVDYFEQRGVIVMGYGGWNDSLMQALMDCKTFKGNLYWCDMHPESSISTKLRSNVQELLAKHPDRSFYVPLPSGGANIAMQEIHKKLGLGNYPKVLVNPLDSLIESIENLRLPDEMPGVASATLDSESPVCIVKNLGDLTDPKVVKNGVLSLLNDFKEEFTDPRSPQGKLVLARSVALCGNWDSAIQQLNVVIDSDESSVKQKSEAYFMRGFAKREIGDEEGEISDYSAVIELEGAYAWDVAIALLNRGNYRKEEGDIEGAISDYSALMELKGAPVNQVAKALLSRGIARGKKGDVEGGILDYSALIELKGAPVDQVAMALVNRGIARVNNEDIEDGISDLSAVIDLKGAPVIQVAIALGSRGAIKEILGNLKGAVADTKASLELNDVSEEIRNIVEEQLRRLEQKMKESDESEGAMD